MGAPVQLFRAYISSPVPTGSYFQVMKKLLQCNLQSFSPYSQLKPYRPISATVLHTSCKLAQLRLVVNRLQANKKQAKRSKGQSQRHENNTITVTACTPYIALLPTTALCDEQTSALIAL